MLATLLTAAFLVGLALLILGAYLLEPIAGIFTAGAVLVAVPILYERRSP